MVSWILTPCMRSLLNEFNILAPNRDKSSDGSIGDSAHASSSSDHNPDETGNTPQEDSDNINEVRAIDVDEDLRLPGVTMESRVQIIVTRHRKGEDNRLKNVIYNKRIWSESWGWTEREYTGSNPHDKHAHFSGKASADNKTGPWGLLEGIEDDMNLPKQGDKGESVRYWQYVLSRITSRKIVVDGIYSPDTAKELVIIWQALGGEGKFDGSYISGWLGMKMHQQFAYNSAPKPKDETPIIPDKTIEDFVNAWLNNRISGTNLTINGTIDATVFLEEQ